MSNSIFEFLSDAGDVLATAPIPDEALIEGADGSIKVYQWSAIIERDGKATTFRWRGRDGQLRTGRIVESTAPHDPRAGVVHLDRTSLVRGERLTGRATALTVL